MQPIHTFTVMPGVHRWVSSLSPTTLHHLMPVDDVHGGGAGEAAAFSGQQSS